MAYDWQIAFPSTSNVGICFNGNFMAMEMKFYGTN